jgi:alkylation response protein AidB-like acyl-CoA dehydrogenase
LKLGKRAAIIGGAIPQGLAAMNLDFTSADETFRKEVRSFIAENMPAQVKGKGRGQYEGKDDFMAWHKVLYKKGWVAPSWPKEYGGTGWTSTQKYIFGEECASADTPATLPFGLAMVGPVIYTFGNEEQKKDHLRRFFPASAGGARATQAGSGSDLPRR